jgi:hypothetical protein
VTEDNEPKIRRGVVLNDLASVRRLVQRIVSRAFKEDAELEYSGRISQLVTVWLKAYELEKVSDLEKRVIALENDRRRG